MGIKDNRMMMRGPQRAPRTVIDRALVILVALMWIAVALTWQAARWNIQKAQKEASNPDQRAQAQKGDWWEESMAGKQKAKEMAAAKAAAAKEAGYDSQITIGRSGREYGGVSSGEGGSRYAARATVGGDLGDRLSLGGDELEDYARQDVAVVDNTKRRRMKARFDTSGIKGLEEVREEVKGRHLVFAFEEEVSSDDVAPATVISRAEQHPVFAFEEEVSSDDVAHASVINSAGAALKDLDHPPHMPPPCLIRARVAANPAAFLPLYLMVLPPLPLTPVALPPSLEHPSSRPPSLPHQSERCCQPSCLPSSVPEGQSWVHLTFEAPQELPCLHLWSLLQGQSWVHLTFEAPQELPCLHLWSLLQGQSWVHLTFEAPQELPCLHLWSLLQGQSWVHLLLLCL
ncbi:unnamed protein product [Closterium sp. Naga37s-1]|nr:unnamed protein product [Closterium sp. Naga37s-1]